MTYRDILDQGDLLAEYDAECATPEMGKSDPQAEIYRAMEESGAMRCFGVYEGETMIGFASVFVYVVPHYGRKAALTESIFVAKARRGSPAGVELIDAAVNYGADCGCKVVYCSAPAGSAFEKLLERRRDFRRSNSAFVKAL